MGIVGALDLLRRQITYRWQDLDTGEVRRGRIAPGAREPLRGWLAGLPRTDVHLALEGTTGWRFVVEELEGAGFTPHLADPAEAAANLGSAYGVILHPAPPVLISQRSVKDGYPGPHAPDKSTPCARG